MSAVAAEFGKELAKFLADCGDGDTSGVFEQGRRHIRSVRALVAKPLDVLLPAVHELMTQAAMWRASLAARTDASDAQFVLQRLYEDNLLYARDAPLKRVLRALLVSVVAVGDEARRPSRVTLEHVTQMLWQALGAATRFRRIKHDGTAATYTSAEMSSVRVAFDDTDRLTLYYLAGYAGRCVTTWRSTLNAAALASSSSPEFVVLTAIYGNETIMRTAPFAHKVARKQVRLCVC